jgi:hypothetical protein
MARFKFPEYQFLELHKCSICAAVLFLSLAFALSIHPQWWASLERQTIWYIRFESDYVSLVCVGAFVLLFLILWRVPKLQVADPALTGKERIELENSARVTLAQILGGAVVLGGLYFTWQNLRVSEEGQITERFTRAIDQLGNEKLQIRLGAIFALERIAKDSPSDLRTPILEILAAYVRERDPWKEVGKAPVGDIHHAWPKENDVYSCIRQYPSAVQNLYERAPDIQSIMTIIGKRPREELAREGKLIDLSGTDLRGADLNYLNLSYLDLSVADLEGACLEFSDLYGSDLTGTNLRFAMMDGLDLSGVMGLGRDQLAEANGPPKKFPFYWPKPSDTRGQ